MKTQAQKAFRLLAASRNVAIAQDLALGGWEIESRLDEVTIYHDDLPTRQGCALKQRWI